MSRGHLKRGEHEEPGGARDLWRRRRDFRRQHVLVLTMSDRTLHSRTLSCNLEELTGENLRDLSVTDQRGQASSPASPWASSSTRRRKPGEGMAETARAQSRPSGEATNADTSAPR